MRQFLLALFCWLLCLPCFAQGPSYSSKTVYTDKVQTLTNKTLVSPVITGSSTISTPIISGNITIELGANDTTLIFSAPSAARQITFGDPGGNDFVVYGAAAQTLTNKTIGVSQLTGTLPIARGGTNNGSLGVLATGIYAGNGSALTQITGSALQSFRVNAAGTAIEAFTPAGAGDVTGPASATNRSVVLFDGTTGKLLKDGVALGTAGQVLVSNGAAADPSFQTVAGTGDVVGPASATDRSVPLFDGVTGKLLKDGVALGTSGQVLTSNGAGVDPTFQTVVGTGDVVGPASATDRSVALFNGGTGKLLKDGVALGTSGQVLTSNGAGVDPTFQTGSGGGAPTDGTYIMVTLNGTLTDERQLTAGKGVTPTDGGPNGAFTLAAEEQIADVRFGGDGQRAIPTSGTLTGEYWNDGNYTTTGVITCNRCRWHVRGTVNINHAITVNTEMAGGRIPTAAFDGMAGQDGAGIAGGQGGPASVNSTVLDDPAGAGGGCGGAGGDGSSDGQAATVSLGGSAYSIEHILSGSGGGAGAFDSVNNEQGKAGGAGGGGFLLEVTGAVTIDANISLNGQAGTGGTGGAGGGGSGGVLDMRSQNTVTINATRIISASGGAGGTGIATRGDGGGGGGGIVFIRGSTVTNNGTVTVAGGAAGGADATAGATGISDLASTVYGRRSPN